MSKTFTKAPKPKQPSLDEIAAFERGGTGTDRREKVTPVAATPEELTKRLSLDLPESVHRRFKTACSATGRKMVSEVATMIDRRIRELEAEAGLSKE